MRVDKYRIRQHVKKHDTPAIYRIEQLHRQRFLWRRWEEWKPLGYKWDGGYGGCNDWGYSYYEFTTVDDAEAFIKQRRRDAQPLPPSRVVKEVPGMAPVNDAIIS
jgi:hypothetical protein